MNKIVILFIVFFASVVLSARQKEKESCECEECEDPCDDCDEPNIRNCYYTTRVEQEATEVTYLKCTPDSYFSSLTWESCYPLNTTCFSVEKTNNWAGTVVYTGKTRCDQDNLDLEGDDDYRTTWMWNNGNVQRRERGHLAECGDCEGDLLVSYYNYVTDDPINGCCSDEICVDRLTATAAKVQIFGKCCSTCYLHKSSITWEESISN